MQMIYTVCYSTYSIRTLSCAIWFLFWLRFFRSFGTIKTNLNKSPAPFTFVTCGFCVLAAGILLPHELAFGYNFIWPHIFHMKYVYSWIKFRNMPNSLDWHYLNVTCLQTECFRLLHPYTRVFQTVSHILSRSCIDGTNEISKCTCQRNKKKENKVYDSEGIFPFFGRFTVSCSICTSKINISNVSVLVLNAFEFAEKFK